MEAALTIAALVIMLVADIVAATRQPPVPPPNTEIIVPRAVEPEPLEEFAPDVVLVQAQAQEYRLDTFDTKGNRTGYSIIRPGRVDTFDTRSRRTGSGVLTGNQTDQPNRTGTIKGGKSK